MDNVIRQTIRPGYAAYGGALAPVYGSQLQPFRLGVSGGVTVNRKP